MSTIIAVNRSIHIDTDITNITDSLKHIYLYTIHIFMLKVFADRQMKSLEEELQLAERDGQGELVAEEGMYA